MSAAAVELGAPVPLERSSRVEEIEEKEVEDLTEIVDNMKIAETAPDPEKVMKHPLQNAWTLWFFKNDKTRSWEENQRPIITVTTVEDFWSLYNHIEVASRLPPGSDYSLFFLIGEHADQHAHQVNGAVVNVRAKGDKLAVWLADAGQPDGITRIGKMIKERLGIDPDQTIGFNIHNEEKAAARNAKTKKFFV